MVYGCMVWVGDVIWWVLGIYLRLIGDKLFGLSTVGEAFEEKHFASVVEPLLTDKRRGMRNYSDKLRSEFVDRIVVPDNDAIPKGRRFVDRLPCGLAHPGLCPHKHPDTFADGLAIMEGFSKLVKDHGKVGSFYSFKAKPPIDEFMCMVGYIRLKAPLVVVVAKLNACPLGRFKWARTDDGLIVAMTASEVAAALLATGARTSIGVQEVRVRRLQLDLREVQEESRGECVELLTAAAFAAAEKKVAKESKAAAAADIGDVLQAGFRKLLPVQGAGDRHRSAEAGVVREAKTAAKAKTIRTMAEKYQLKELKEDDGSSDSSGMAEDIVFGEVSGADQGEETAEHTKPAENGRSIAEIDDIPLSLLTTMLSAGSSGAAVAASAPLAAGASSSSAGASSSSGPSGSGAAAVVPLAVPGSLPDAAGPPPPSGIEAEAVAPLAVPGGLPDAEGDARGRGGGRGRGRGRGGRREKRGTDWHGFSIASVMQTQDDGTMLQIGWGCVCGRHRNSHDKPKSAACKKQITYGLPGSSFLNDAQCIVRLKRWLVLGLYLRESTRQRQDHLDFNARELTDLSEEDCDELMSAHVGE